MTGRLRELLLPVLLLGGLWLLLTDLAPGGWMLAVPVVIAAAWAAARLRGAGGGMSVLGLLRFVPFFLRESLRGGLDVARRILRPAMRVNPGFCHYRLRLQGQAARLLFLNTVSLLPGTLSAELDGDVLRVHALDTGADIDGELRALEDISAGVYREAL
jgi:multicomponent Na+:H+ antiporter subunit E